jgi:hypothetical protein
LLKLDCERSPYLETIIQELTNQNFNVQVHTVPYEFQKGGNQMLKVKRMP